MIQPKAASRTCQRSIYLALEAFLAVGLDHIYPDDLLVIYLPYKKQWFIGI